MAKQMYDGLMKIPRVEVYGPEPKRRVAILSFNVNNMSPNTIALALDRSANIIVRSGHHCTMPLIKSFTKNNGTARASAYFYNTKEEINKLVSAVEKIAKNMDT